MPSSLAIYLLAIFSPFTPTPTSSFLSSSSTAGACSSENRNWERVHDREKERRSTSPANQPTDLSVHLANGSRTDVFWNLPISWNKLNTNIFFCFFSKFYNSSLQLPIIIMTFWYINRVLSGFECQIKWKVGKKLK